MGLFQSAETFKCPHCGVTIASQPTIQPLVESKLFKQSPEPLLVDGFYLFHKHLTCPSCRKQVLSILWSKKQGKDGLVGWEGLEVVKEQMIVPRSSGRPPVPSQVPKRIAKDYNEACLVLTDSSNASAALSRRCLQNILRDAAKVKAGNLDDEIRQVVEGGALPSYISSALDNVRQLGNFAAHPMVDIQSGTVLDVEPQEAEYVLGVIEALFDHYYVQPQLLKNKKEAINAKLRAVGKKEMP